MYMANQRPCESIAIEVASYIMSLLATNPRLRRPKTRPFPKSYRRKPPHLIPISPIRHLPNPLSPQITPRICLELLIPLQRILRRIQPTPTLHSLRWLIHTENHASPTAPIHRLNLLVHIEIASKLPGQRRVMRFVCCESNDEACGAW